MTDSTVDISDTLGTILKLLKIIDNGDGTFSASTGISGMTIGPRVQTPTGNVLQVQIGPGDPISNVPVVILLPDHQIHEGETHHAIDKRLTLNATTVKYAFTVAAYADVNSCPHFTMTVDTFDGHALVDLYEGATFTGGTLLTKFNKNRNSANTDVSTITAGVTSTDGTLIDSFYIGAGVKATGRSGVRNEWILKSNTIYRIDVIGGVNPTSAIISFEYYADMGV
jgi:hypothetical protein